MQTSPIARRYAKAYFDLAEKAEEIPRWHKELHQVNEVLSTPEVSAAMTNPRVRMKERVNLGLAALEDVIKPARNLARLLIERRRTSLAPNILKAYDQLVDQVAGIVPTRIVTAVPLSETQATTIVDSLGKSLNKKIRVKFEYDPASLGGLTIYFGDRVIDDSLRTRLAQLRVRLI